MVAVILIVGCSQKTSTETTQPEMVSVETRLQQAMAATDARIQDEKLYCEYFCGCQMVWVTGTNVIYEYSKVVSGKWQNDTAPYNPTVSHSNPNNGMSYGEPSYFKVLDVGEDGAIIRSVDKNFDGIIYVKGGSGVRQGIGGLTHIPDPGDIFVKGLTGVYSDRVYAGPLKMKETGAYTYKTIMGATRRIPAYELWQPKG